MNLAYYNLNDVHIGNLAKLRDHLWDRLQVQDGITFDMSRFAKNPTTTYRERTTYTEARTDCGTAGCAVGHAPQIGNGFEKYPNETWNTYSERMFGLKVNTLAWSWMFDSMWATVGLADTPKAAAQRIHWLLEGREIPTRQDGALDLTDFRYLDIERTKGEQL